MKSSCWSYCASFSQPVSCPTSIVLYQPHEEFTFGRSLCFSHPVRRPKGNSPLEESSVSSITPYCRELWIGVEGGGGEGQPSGRGCAITLFKPKAIYSPPAKQPKHGKVRSSQVGRKETRSISPKLQNMLSAQLSGIGTVNQWIVLFLELATQRCVWIGPIICQRCFPPGKHTRAELLGQFSKIISHLSLGQPVRNINCQGCT
jgi:hypothetical protein